VFPTLFPLPEEFMCNPFLCWTLWAARDGHVQAGRVGASSVLPAQMR